MRLLVARHQDPDYFAAGYKSAHEWLTAIRAVHRPLLPDDGFIVQQPGTSQRPPGIPLQVELVPKPCWWSNLRSNLPAADWQTLRRIVNTAAGYMCEVCCYRDPRYTPDIHEQWSYDETRGIQKLERMIALCKKCHGAVHMGLARVKGMQQQAEDHLMEINGWDLDRLEGYLLACDREWHRRNEINWSLDISYIELLGVAVPAKLDRP